MNWQDILNPEVQKDSILGVPYAAEDPRTLKTALASDAYEILFGLRNQSQDILNQLNNPNLMRLTRDRLKRFHAANEEHALILRRHFSTLVAWPS